MVDQKFSEKVATEDIKAEVEKTIVRLIFSGIVLFMILIGFCVRTCSKMPERISDSVQCSKLGNQWIPESYVVVNGLSHTIDAYCSLKKENK